MFDYRPKLQIEKSKLQKIANVIGYSIFVLGVIVSIGSLPFLPDSVPIHFNIAGEADSWGSKYFVLVLPIIALVTTLAMEAIENKPHLHNYPARINESNVEAFYKLSIRTMNVTKNAMLIIFGLIMFDIVVTAKTEEPLFQTTIIILLLGFVFVPIIWHLVSMRKIK